jgi:hypothetical protein
MVKNYIGERFGDYKLTRPLGEGGFAYVYLGEHVHNKTLAAVKIPIQQQVQGFINELRRTVLLQHPHIIKIIDFGIRQTDGPAFITMEYAPNGSLREKYKDGECVPLDTIVSYANQIASALQYAHDQRIIHYLQLAYQHREVEPPSLRDKLPALPLAAEQVVMKALAKEPKDRFDRVATFADYLDKAAHQQPLPPFEATASQSKTSVRKQPKMTHNHQVAPSRHCFKRR